MTNTEGLPPHSIRRTPPTPAAEPGGAASLADRLVAGAHPAAMLLPGIDAAWPRALADVLLGRPELADWVTAVLAELDAWSATAEVRALGQFADGFSGMLAADADADADADDPAPGVGSGPGLLVGALLVDAVSLMALESDGLAPLRELPATRVLGHSAGLLAARLAGGARDAAGLIPVADAVRVAQVAALVGAQAARHRWAVSDAAVARARSGDERAAVPMVAIAGPRTSRLREILAGLADRLPDPVAVAVTNTATRHVVVGSPAALAELREAMQRIARGDAERRSAGRQGGAPLRFAWEPLACPVPFHHPDLEAAAVAVVARARALGLSLPPADRLTVLDPATGRRVPDGDGGLEGLVASLLTRAQDWSGTVATALPRGGVAIMASPLGALGRVSASALRGRGVLLVDASDPRGRTALFAAGRAPAIPTPWAAHAPAAIRGADGVLRLANRHTALTGRSPMILPGMTPTTAEAPIVAAAANAGHVAELAGGGQVSPRIFDERVAELAELLEPGQEVVLNALYLDPHLWGLHLGRERLLLKARAAGAPFMGVTISAGIPDKPEALALLAELRAAGVWLNALKPGTAAQVTEALSIAADWPHPLWIHLEGGAAGGHHSWEDLDELLLATYHRIREHDNVVLAVGGGIGDPQRAADLLTGTWAHAHGAPTMPVDAVLLGTVTMATLEAATSASVKAALAATAGHDGWVTRGSVAGGTTSGRSGLDADIHFLENSAARAARLLDEVAGDPMQVAARRGEIVAALARTAKPYFGDVAEMTYAEVLARFVELSALGRGGRYEDGAWLDPSHRSRFVDLLQRAEARLHPQDSGTVPTLFADPGSVDDPAAALDALVGAHPQARTALLHPADVAHFLAVCRGPGKPVPFVPVIDADVRRWYQSDSLWQSHSDRYDADQVLVIPGPIAVAGIGAVDEPVAALLDRFEAAVASDLLAAGTRPSDPARASDPARPSDPAFRLGVRGGPVPADRALLEAALAAPTWHWMGAARRNPLLGIAAADQWRIADGVARWADARGESAELVCTSPDALVLTVSWPDLGLIGDGRATLAVRAIARAGTVTFAVDEAALAAAGHDLLAMFSGGTDAPTDPADLAASHAASVGSSHPLPDRVMARLWPQVFAALAAAGQSAALFDLVHLRHEVVAGEGASAGGADPPLLTSTEGGLVIEVSSRAPGARVRDRFFVRRAHVDPGLPRTGAPGTVDAVATPRRALGALTVRAPMRLEAFATISGDPNPIHRSDALARLVGLPGRIVHGMWTSAAATRAVLELAAAGDPGRLRSWAVEFVAPVRPGQAVTFTLTRTGMRDGARVVAVEAATADGVVALGTARVAPPRTLYVFPGQGIQSRGMGMDGYARSAAARRVWDSADALTRERLGFSILAVVRDNPASIGATGRTFRHRQGVLNLTQFTQVAMATLAAAQVAELREAGAFDPEAAVAGHSVGEYNALAAFNDVLPLASVIELVFARGMAMHGLVPRDDEGRSDYRLAVVRPHLAGLTHAQAQDLVDAVAAESGQLCEIVNHNLRGKQYAVAGSVAALAVLAERLGAGEPGRAPLLGVPGIDVPFHSSALRPGVDEFRHHLLAKLPPRIDADALVGRYIPNLYPVTFRLDRAYVEGVQGVCQSSVLAELLGSWDQRAGDRDGLARLLLVELLAWQFASPVRWIETFELACAPVEQGGLGVGRIIEVGVGTAPTLANLAKGSLALPGHRGARPWVANVEVDAEAVFERAGNPPDPQPEPGPSAQAGPAAAAGPAPAAGPAAPEPAPEVGAPAPADLPVDHATALAALLALRVSVRPDQLEHDSIELLVDGASSRRNQVLMDIGKEFGVPAIDGAHELPLPELTAKLAQRSTGYCYPGPVLGAAVDAALTAALGPRGSSAPALAKRVSGHWGLAEGWTARVALTLALGTREGASRRGGDLVTVTGESADELVDAAVRVAAEQAGVGLAPARAAATRGEVVDASAVHELREHVEGILVDQAAGVLARLGRLPRSEQDETDHREALATLALLESEHGPAALVAPRFDARRHVLLDSATVWARADVDHLVHAALRAEAGVAAWDADAADALIAQIAAHRCADGRIEAALGHHRARAVAAGRKRAVAEIDRALAAQPAGIAVPDLADLGRALSDGMPGEVLAEAQRLTTAPGMFTGEVVLVTGASPGSIAWATLAHLLRGGATVVLATTTDTPERIEAYRDLERRVSGPGAQLHVVPANMACFADVDALLDWLTTPTVLEVGPIAREVKPALWPTIVLPFAAAPAGGELPDTGQEAQLTLRLLLLGVQRLVGGLADRVVTAGRDPFTVVLPLSPNHGTFGGDGAYGEAKAALETMVNKWRSEGGRWGRATRLVAAEIGWVRGTGLMAGNDALARRVERDLGVSTFSSQQMGALVAALASPAMSERAAAGPVRVDLSGGLSGRDDLAQALAGALAGVTPEGAAGVTPEAAAGVTPEGPGAPVRGPGRSPVAAGCVPALPNLPEVLRAARAELTGPSLPDRARIRAEDMIVLVGIAEVGPWGGSSTRWEAEVGRLSAAGVIELAWRTGLIDWDAARATWTDAGTGEPVAEADVAGHYREQVQARCGVRPLVDTPLVAASGAVELTEVFLDGPLTIVLPTQAEARALAAGAAGALVTAAESGWLLMLPAGSAIRVPRRRPLPRSVGGQLPAGSDPTRLGLEPGVAGSMDPLAAWNIVVTAEALSGAGVTPEELVGAVHPSLVANTQGSGMGGMHSIQALYMAPMLGRVAANDVLQEALGNVVPAHANQGLVGGYGPMVHPVAACATAAVSLEEAVDKIALGKASIVVGGGWDDLSSEGITGFANMAATADSTEMMALGLAPHQHSRPGDRRRRGFVESQGGGSFLVCRGSVALALGLPVRAVVGYAASFGDGIHTSIPAPGLGALGAARGGPQSPLARALADLGLTADDIEVVSKHDTSTEANDPNEAFVHAQLQSALGRTPGAPLRVVSQKALTGHAKGGAAAWQLAGLCDIFATGVVPGNANLVSVDPRVTPECLVVDHRGLQRAEPVRAALLTSLGFGHVSAVVALAHPDVFVAAIPDELRAGYLVRARERRVAGARHRLAAQHGGEPLLARRTDRRLGSGAPEEVRAREAAMLLDPEGVLPDPGPR